MRRIRKPRTEWSVLGFASFVACGGPPSTVPPGAPPPPTRTTTPVAAPIATVARDAEEVECAALRREDCRALAARLVAAGDERGEGSRGLRLYGALCNKGDPTSCTALGRLLLWGARDVFRDPARAERLLTHACNQGERTACLELGSMYLEGHGVPTDAVRATQVFEQGCARDDPACCTALAHVFSSDRAGVPKDEARAAALYDKACEMQEPFADVRDVCVHAAVAHRDGVHVASGTVDRDAALAARQFRRACDRGDSAGCMFLGDLYESGTGVAKDPIRAAAEYRAGCEGGQPVSCQALSALLASRAVVPRGAESTKKRIVTACSAGKIDACDDLARWGKP